MPKPFRGYFDIANTPFTADGAIIWADLEREWDFIARSGAHGLVWPVNDSEFSLMSYPERVEGFKRATSVIVKRIPVVLGVADTNASGAASLAEAAAKAGADAVVAMPPWHTKLGTRLQYIAYYRAIAEASGLPVCIQNLFAPMGSDLSAEAVEAICNAVPQVQYIKEERMPQGDCVSSIIDRNIPQLKAVFGGGWCFSMIAHHKRGDDGNMASSAVPEVHARIWDLMEAGKEDEANHIQLVLNELMRAETSVQSLHGVKQSLVLRGIFTSMAMRNVAPRVLDEPYLHEFERALALLQPYLKKV
jgi:4-hydroxy-tetrahydrodipicolinate synthase